MGNTKISPEDYFRAVSLCGLSYTKKPTHSSGFYNCPQHRDKTPSLSISFTKGIFHCLSCHWSGTINSLCYNRTGKYINELLSLESKFSLQKEEYIYEEELPDEKNINLDIRGVLLPFEEFNKAKNYLISRGINLDIARKFNIKYAKDIYINTRRFIERIMIPVYGETGRLINYEGRVIDRKLKPKVIYPNNTIKPIFNIQNLNIKEPLFLVEGLIDYFLLQEDSFFENSSVLFGSYVSPYQREMLRKFSEIIIIPNNDEAGDTSVEVLNEVVNTNFDKKISIYKMVIMDKNIKDVGEIWEKKQIKVKEYRERNGFKLIKNNSFLL